MYQIHGTNEYRPRDDSRSEQRPPRSGRGLRYGRVFFGERNSLGLSVSEYLLADIISTLSRRTGWCYASRPYLASMLGVSVRQVQRLLVKLRQLGLVEGCPHSARQIRTTSEWRRAHES